MDYLAGLNPQQRDAVAHVEGPLLLLAGAGSGKTRVITHRIAHLIENHKIPGPAVLAVTFTNKAADEMRQRVGSLLTNAAKNSLPLVSTFHSFCVRMLRRDAATLSEIRPGFTRQFTIYDDDDQVALLKSIYKQLGLDEKFMPYRGALSRISHGKSHHETPLDWYKAATDPKLTRLAKIYETYEERLLQANALDFDDLLLESVRLLKHDEALRTIYNRRYEFVMIDEYQDTNRSQYELIQLLTATRKNIAVVGDEDQSIYGWRGADIRNILDFERDYPNAVVIRLEQNYRSTKNILEAASAVVANNKERKGKWLWTDSQQGTKIGYYEAPDGENEALFIADTIEKLLSKNPVERVAVLYRTNSQSRQIEEALRRYGRKYLVVGGFSFYQRAEVKDLLAYLKVLLSPQDSLSLLRIINTPARGIGKGTVEQTEQYALEQGLSVANALPRMLDQKLFPTRAESAVKGFLRMIDELRESTHQKPVHEILRDILAQTGYETMLKADTSPEAESRLANLEELVNAAAEAAERGETAAEFLDHAALIADSDALDEQAQVSLLTVHNAKGLEFPNVFVAGLEEGIFPHSRSFNGEPAMEEERRLCYVAMTRAEKRLYFTWARYRRRYGGSQPEVCLPSRFLNEVPPSLRENLSSSRASFTEEVNLYGEQHEVRESVKKNLYTGRTYNSVENIAQFFAERGMPLPAGLTRRPAPPPAAPLPNPQSRPPTPAQGPPPQRPVPPKTPAQMSFGETPSSPAAPRTPPARARTPTTFSQAALPVGAVINHPKYGRGKILRREGDGEDAKLTISFPAYGLKKIIEKYAGIRVNE
ncbi:MAG TPA: UvrD-helicase domain-containing protein [Bryobacteraceae bacterium]|jgi:DNA helicase-2/ATP-dependent DNA helicase PcrA|nr:UvrD-helicase domain-containing protein [Bryobacteraceae bacterium]